MKCSLGSSNFLEEVFLFSLSYSVFLYFFALITEERFLISPCYSLELCIQMGNLSFSPLLLAFLLFTAICKASSDSHFTFLHVKVRHSFPSKMQASFNFMAAVTIRSDFEAQENKVCHYFHLQGNKPASPAFLNHWTPREIPVNIFNAFTFWYCDCRVG